MRYLIFCSGKENENQSSVIEEAQAVHEYILPVLQTGAMIFSTKNISKNAELQINYRAAEVYIYDSTTLIKAHPQKLCYQKKIPEKACKTLPSGK